MPKFRMNIVVCLRRLNDAERATVLVGAVYRFATLQIFRNVGKADPVMLCHGREDLNSLEGR